ncbi:PhzF family phenazine biosynthesis protein [Arthrobacter sp. CAN_C5]|uniref:PhzF family phenazine biosynthesis protein n=1 Tax=Arthrobacter sp. CAN_C5 TaxID=2760706 RepID=UPI001AEAB30D|nr:PhzF family phenazine biosynthesis isomerase [Arthrobacter sp. CAN_C5]MBP2216953.1 PhzF family phenazine biosynthesis protein [Arthrobacter sp. CAN_C5]
MEILSYRAFTTPDSNPRSGNMAGVVIDAEALSGEDMLRIAAELGYSETAFLNEVTSTSARVRYFTPLDEIPFCGHATIASGVALSHRGAGPVLAFHTNVGEVLVDVTPGAATLTAVETVVEPLDDELLDLLLAALRLSRGDLDPALPAAFIRGANPHPIVFVGPDVLASLDHDHAAVLALQNREAWNGTVPVVHRHSPTHFVSRNPFPRGGIREDPATGSAAAGLGSYLRAGGHVELPAVIRIEQGAETGRPSLLVVEIPLQGRIRVTGTASVS